MACLFWLVYIFWIQETIERGKGKWSRCLLIYPKARAVSQWWEEHTHSSQLWIKTAPPALVTQCAQVCHQLLGLSLVAPQFGNVGQEDMKLSTCNSNPAPEAAAAGGQVVTALCGRTLPRMLTSHQRIQHTTKQGGHHSHSTFAKWTNSWINKQTNKTPSSMLHILCL